MFYLIIFISTIYLTSRCNLMYENLTGVAQIPQFHYPVIIFTILTSIFFAYKMLKVFQNIHINHLKIYQMMIILTAFIMSIGSLFPYQMNGTDIHSKLHVYCSMFGCLSFLILLFIYTRKLSIYHPHLYMKIHWFYDFSLQFLCILLIVFTRVNGYIEILFAGIVCLYLYMIEKNI